jgi:hypothetical protein
MKNIRLFDYIAYFGIEDEISGEHLFAAVKKPVKPDAA